MDILTSLGVVVLLVLSFIAGLRLDNYYHTKAAIAQKEALERQFMRLRVGADADDPCKPYGTPRYSKPVPLIDEQFMDQLKTTGRAKTSFRKSDLTK